MPYANCGSLGRGKKKKNEIKADPFDIIYKGEYKYSLNRCLAAEKGIAKKDGDNYVVIDEERLQDLQDLHFLKLSIFELMESVDDKGKLRVLAKSIEDIEFDLQETWGFEMDSNFHEWFMVPKCTCPKMDNRDRMGTKYRVYAGSCPIHWVEK